jgi:hypothetical protein
MSVAFHQWRLQFFGEKQKKQRYLGFSRRWRCQCWSYGL